MREINFRKGKLFLRKAEKSDVSGICTLADQLGYNSSLDNLKKRLNEILNLNDHTVIVAEYDKSVIAWIHAFEAKRIESQFFIEIGGVIVDEEFRNLGIGKLLFEEIQTWTSAKRFKKIRIRSNALRIESHKFFKGIGFQWTKDQKIYDLKIS